MIEATFYIIFGFGTLSSESFLLMKFLLYFDELLLLSIVPAYIIYVSSSLAEPLSLSKDCSSYAILGLKTFLRLFFGLDLRLLISNFWSILLTPAYWILIFFFLGYSLAFNAK